MQKRAIHQLVHTLSYGDAISNEVLALKRFFENQGLESEVYALNVHPKYKHLGLDYRKLDPNTDSGIILHYSLGSPLNDLYRRQVKAERVLIYHNITPPSWFYGVNPRVARDIEHGLKELPELCALSDRLIADSLFNATELKKLGFEAQVIELPVDPIRWQENANTGILSMLRNAGGVHVLHVGRIAPNKCIEDIIKIFYFLHYHVERKSRLWLVGIDTDTELYSFGLKRLVRELELDSVVHFTGGMADSEVRALYEGSSVYLCMSEHEGFCLPVLEAMYFGLPVIAYASSALPDTVGRGGILCAEKKYFEIAELIGCLAKDVALREKVVKAGAERVKELSCERFEEKVTGLFGEKRSREKGVGGSR